MHLICGQHLLWRGEGNVTLPWLQNVWITTIGSLSKDDDDGNENGKKGICLY